LCDGWVFPTPDGKAHFGTVAPAERSLARGEFLLATRRGKQFNSMIWRAKDPLTGAARDAVFIAATDAAALGLDDGAAVTVRSPVGVVDGRLKVAPIRAGNVQMFWPEANALVPAGVRDAASHVPDYNAVVRIEPRLLDQGAWIAPSG
jgi:anaerobic selenocysteine-containing dehydrogenase